MELGFEGLLKGYVTIFNIVEWMLVMHIGIKKNNDFFFLQINCLHDNYSRYSYLHYLQKEKKKKLLTNQLLALLTGQLLT